jgi:hypothetical protein
VHWCEGFDVLAGDWVAVQGRWAERRDAPF